MDRDVMTERFAASLRAAMTEQGITEAELSRKAKAGATAVRDILQGKSKSPTIRTASRIAEALGLSLPMMLEDESDAALRAEVMAIFLRLPPQDRKKLATTGRAWIAELQPPSRA